MSGEEQVDYEYPDQNVSMEEDQSGEIGHDDPSSENNKSNSNNGSGFKNIRHAPNAEGIVDNVLFLSRFAFSTTVDEIRATLSKFGPLGDISITNGGKIAFIDFVNAEDCLRAKNELHGQPGFGNDSLIADFKKPPLRAPGGRGGPRDFRDDRDFRNRDRDLRVRDRDRDRDRDGYRPRDGLSDGYEDRRRPGPDRDRDYRAGPPSRPPAGLRDYDSDYRGSTRDLPPRGRSDSRDLREEASRLQRQPAYLPRGRSHSRERDRRPGPPPAYRDEYSGPPRDAYPPEREPPGRGYYDSAPPAHVYPPARDYRDDPYRSSGPPPPPGRYPPLGPPPPYDSRDYDRRAPPPPSRR